MNGTFPTVNLTQRYDIETDTWTTVAPMPVAFNHLNAAVIDGKIYVLGGMVLENGLWNSSRSAFVYDPCTDAWTDLDLIPAGRQAGSAAVGVKGTTIYLAGGILSTFVGNFSVDQPNAFLDDTTDMFTSYDTVSKEWTSLPNMPAPRDHAGRGLVGNKLYVLAGRAFNSVAKNGNVNTTFSYDIDALVWSTDLADQPTARGGLSSATIDDVIYTIGGEGNTTPGTNGVFDNTEAYDTVSNTWQELTTMAVARHGSGAVAVDRRIYFPGGGTSGGGMPTFFFDYLQQ